MVSKAEVQRKYVEYKGSLGKRPLLSEFLKYAELSKEKLIQLFGRDAYSKLQLECGDEPNKLSLERVPLGEIMRQYADLARKLGESPRSSDWNHSGCKPTSKGLIKSPHFIKWPEMHAKFAQWCKDEAAQSYEDVLLLTGSANEKISSRKRQADDEFTKLVQEIRKWSPARGRASEGEYKVELRGHLKSLGYSLNEEFGESNIDLLVSKKIAIETKKDPNLGEYDRLFGQLARHLTHHAKVVALIFNAPSGDNFDKFASLVDEYFNEDSQLVEVIKK